MSELDTLIQSHIDDGVALGVAVAILKRGDIDYMNGFGVTTVEEHGTRISPDTLFGYGSIAKNICAVLVMRLVEQGLLDLDTPIQHYLPDLTFTNAEYGRRIALRHLLSHTSGLPCAGKVWGPRDLDSLRRSVYEQVALYEFVSEPGMVHLYANTVICVAGHIAEAVTGKFYDDLLIEYVFKPLAMTLSTFDPTVAMTYPLALPHEEDSDGVLHTIHQLTRNASGNPSSFGYTNISDLANLAKMYLNHGYLGELQFLSDESVAEMQRSHCDRRRTAVAHPLATLYDGYGLGFEVGNYRGKRTVGHGGMGMSYNCFYYLFPDNQSGMILLTNYCDDPKLMELVGALYDNALDMPYKGLIPVEKPSIESIQLSREQMAEYVGTYIWIEEAEVVTVGSTKEELVLERGGNPYPLIAVGDDRFYSDAYELYRPTIAFVRNDAGLIVHALVDGEPYNPITIDSKLVPDLTLWGSYEGIYKDPTNCNLKEVFRVRIQNDAVIFSEGDDEGTGIAVDLHTFISELGYFDFLDDESGKKILRWGRATRYYPVDADVFDNQSVVKYLVDVPMVIT